MALPPPEEYGPANAGYQGEIGPGAQFDNRLRYADMARKQIVSQYQQGNPQPPVLSLSAMGNVASGQRYQYGVPGGQDPRAYQRQAELYRTAYGASVAKTTLDIGAYGVGGAIGASAGLTGVAGFAFPLLFASVAMRGVTKGVNYTMERQRFMHNMASDIETYRGELGFNNLTYAGTTDLASRLTSTMYGGGFFSKEQQSSIHKIGLSNRMISARGGGIGSGTTKQYQQNFKELVTTTEEVVKLMKTTIEGGMSVIKELQQTGFGSMRQIRNQIRQATALGATTGLGAQNMMMLGAAGAQAVQGTPWAATTGAAMYQAGAGQAAFMARTQGGANAVQRAGGIAAAGGAIANFQMNVLSSGIGAKLAAYAMKPDGTIDNARMGRLLSGKAGAYEVVVGGAERGYNMGISGRVQFERFRANMFNNMSDIGITQAVNTSFGLWGQTRGGNMQAKSWVYAGQFTNNFRDRELMAQWLTSAKGYDITAAQRAADQAAMTDVKGSTQWGLAAKIVGGAYLGAEKAGMAFGRNVVYGAGGLMTAATEAVGGAKSWVGQRAEDALIGLQILGPQGLTRANVGDIRAATLTKYGLGARPAEEDLARVLSMSPSKRIKQRSMGKTDAAYVGKDRDGMIGFIKSKPQADIDYLYSRIGAAIYNQTSGELYKDRRIMDILGTSKGGDVYRSAKEKPFAFASTMYGLMGEAATTITAHSDFFKQKWGEQLEGKNASQKNAANNLRTMALSQLQIYGEIKKGPEWGWSGKNKATEELARTSAQAEYEARKTANIKLDAQVLNIAAYKAAETAAIDKALGYSTKKVQMGGGSVSRTGMNMLGGPSWVSGAPGPSAATVTAVDLGATNKLRKYFQSRGENIKDNRDLMVRAMEIAGSMTEGVAGAGDKAELDELARAFGKKDSQFFYSPEWKAKRKSVAGAIRKTKDAQAENFLDSIATRTVFYLNDTLKKEVGSKNEKLIRGMFAGTLSPSEEKEALGAGMAGLLATAAGVGTSVVSGWQKEGMANVVSEMSKVTAVKSFQQRSAIEQASEDLKRWELLKLEKSKTKNDVKESEREIVAGLRDAQLKYDVALRQPESSRDKTLQPAVQPPILNYWNNKWSL